MKTPSIASFALFGLLVLQVQGQNAQQRLFTVPGVEFSESQQDKAEAIREKMDELGIECRVEAGLRSQQDESGKLTMEFLRKHLGMKNKVDE